MSDIERSSELFDSHIDSVPGKTLIRVEQGRDIKTEIVWRLGDGVMTGAICNKLGFIPGDTDVEQADRVVRREREALDQMKGIMGRSISVNANPTSNLSISGISYDTLEIGGFGYEEWEDVVDGLVIFDPKIHNMFRYPSAENFAEKFPQVTTTKILVGDEFHILHDEFSFMGAYTQKQALSKVAKNLAVLDQMNPADTAFIVPVPILIGRYPDLLGPDRLPAYFIGWRVPFGGMRAGSLRGISSVSTDDLASFFLGSAIIISKSVRQLHDKYGLTHNQLVLQNYNLKGFDNGQFLGYLADFATTYPVSSELPSLSRAVDLNKLMLSAFYAADSLTDGRLETDTIVNLYDSVLSAYLKENPPKFHPRNIDELYTALIYELSRAENTGLIPSTTPPRECWETALQLEKELASTITKS